MWLPNFTLIISIIRSCHRMFCYIIPGQWEYRELIWTEDNFLSGSLQDVDMMDQNGMTPLMWAAYRTHRCVFACVPACFTSLLQILYNNMNNFVFSVDPTRLLLTFNVSVNLGDKYHKNTALHWAVLAGNTTVISLLLEANANVDAQNIKVHTRWTFYRTRQVFLFIVLVI